MKNKEIIFCFSKHPSSCLLLNASINPRHNRWSSYLRISVFSYLVSTKFQICRWTSAHTRSYGGEEKTSSQVGGLGKRLLNTRKEKWIALSFFSLLSLAPAHDDSWRLNTMGEDNYSLWKNGTMNARCGHRLLLCLCDSTVWPQTWLHSKEMSGRIGQIKSHIASQRIPGES